MHPKVSFFLSATDIPKLDRFSESDPFVVVYLRDEETREWTEIYRTVTMQNQKNPKWPDPVIVDYKFEEYQQIRFDIYDRDSSQEDLEKQQFIGSFQTTVSKILSTNRKRLRGSLIDSNENVVKKTVFTILGEIVHSTKDVLTFKFSASKLKRKNLMGLMKSDPFYRIGLSTQTGVAPVIVFESEHKVRTSNPSWVEHKLPLQRICNGDIKRDIRIEVYDWEGNGKHKLIGLFMTCIEELLEKDTFNLIDLKSRKTTSYTGKFNIDKIEIQRQPSFLEYIQGGCEIKLSIGIDFSKNNGNFTDSSSLHYLAKNKVMNQYQQAIISVGQVLQDYDTDQMVGAFGFGAKIADSDFSESYFPISLDNDQAELEGVTGILKAYEENLGKFEASDKCHLSEIIGNITKEIVPVTQDCQSYNVLLLLTTGVIDDLDDTIDTIVETSDEPLSIIIVGLGRGSFTDMKTLDGNTSHLTTSNGKVATRDIVKFVPYLDTVEKGYSVLREETLHELPEQVESFMWQNGIVPPTQD